jgi:hypothetical protein
LYNDVWLIMWNLQLLPINHTKKLKTYFHLNIDSNLLYGNIGTQLFIDIPHFIVLFLVKLFII